MARTVPASQRMRKGATMRCIASALVSMSVSAVSLLAAVDSLLFAEGTTLRARPPISDCRLDATALEDRGRDVGQLGDPGQAGRGRREQARARSGDRSP